MNRLPWLLVLALCSCNKTPPISSPVEAASPAPEDRFHHNTVWTGREMFVWGGYPQVYGANGLASGGAYDPVGNRWRRIGQTGAPEGRGIATTVWTGEEAIVWGGMGAAYLNSGGRYDPRGDSWKPVSQTNAPAPRDYHSAVWTGREMIVVFGFNNNDGKPTHYGDGGRYDPRTDSWRPLSTVNAPAPRRSASAVWTGEKLIVWGGWTGGRFFDDGGIYDPVTDAWSPMTRKGAPSPRNSNTALWTGQEFIIWGGWDGKTLNDGARYNPATDTWTPMSAKGAPSPRSRFGEVWTGQEMLVWSGKDEAAETLPDPLWSYNPASDQWKRVPTLGPYSRFGSRVVWTGEELIYFGGVPTNGISVGGSYHPRTGVWRTLPE